MQQQQQTWYNANECQPTEHDGLIQYGTKVFVWVKDRLGNTELRGFHLRAKVWDDHDYETNNVNNVAKWSPAV